MTNPQPDRLKPGPRRAEPLQPDKPGQGDGPQPTEDDGRHFEQEVAEKQKEQTDTALDNVRKGYD